MANWDAIYDTDRYVFGREPNQLLVDYASIMTSPVLSLAEGEGRNAVYLARQGLEVLAVDASTNGLAKARKLAEQNGVTIQTRQEDLTTWEPPTATYGSAMLFFLHLPKVHRLNIWKRVRATLKPDGAFVLEGYSVEHASIGNIGPSDPAVMFTLEELNESFAGFEILRSIVTQRVVTNNEYHSSNASLVQFVARKPQ